MSSLLVALHSGQYSRAQTELLAFELHDPAPENSNDSSRRFLIRVITRAVLDVCMYPDTNENHLSAKDWLLGNHDAAASFLDLASLVGLDSIMGSITAMADQEGVHRDKIRDLKKQLYNWSSDERS